MTKEEAKILLQATRLMMLGKDNQSISDLYYALEKGIEALEEKPKTGKWIYKSMKGNFCSECDEPSVWNFNYCPNCGTKMEVSE